MPYRTRVNKGLSATESAIGSQFGLDFGLPNLFAMPKSKTATQQTATRYVKIGNRYHALAPRKVAPKQQVSRSQPIFAGDIGLPNLFTPMQPNAAQSKSNPARARRGASTESFGIPDMFGFGMSSPDMWSLKPLQRSQKTGRGSDPFRDWFGI
ncbi:MAG: hypothetical protein JRN52_02035 [Nitrososphaerota archaeon]|nr:hypothetical protein [Nitrososphaerota archaeon]